MYLARIMYFILQILIYLNLVIRNFLVTLRFSLTPNIPYPYEENWYIEHRKQFLNTNLFLIKPFLITKFDCSMYFISLKNSLLKIYLTQLPLCPLAPTNAQRKAFDLHFYFVIFAASQKRRNVHSEERKCNNCHRASQHSQIPCAVCQLSSPYYP